MIKLFISSILVLTFCVGTFAQSNEISPCPTIDVSGPTGIPDADEPMVFTATLSKEAEKFNPNYKWTASNGEIIQGQKSLAVKVLQKDLGKPLIVSLEVSGLPKECVNTASVATHYEPPIQAVLLDETASSSSRINKAGANKISLTLQKPDTRKGWKSNPAFFILSNSAPPLRPFRLRLP